MVVVPTAYALSPQARIVELRQQREALNSELALLEQRVRPRDQIRKLYEAFNARDADGVASVLSEDVVYEDLLLGASTVCRGKTAFKRALQWHPAFVGSKLELPLGRLDVVVDEVACDGSRSVGVEWHVEWNKRPVPLGRGLSLATLDDDGKLDRVVDICEAPWRVVGLVVRPGIEVVTALSAAFATTALAKVLNIISF